MIKANMLWAQKMAQIQKELDVPLRANVDRVVRQLFADIAEEALHGRRVLIPGFGIFVKKTRRARRVRNPQTRELMILPPAVSVGFRCSKAIKR